MKEYFIFYWRNGKKDVIEAYPIHSELTRQHIKHCVENKVNDWAIVSSPSRNQARRSAYINWINSSGKDYNKW